MTEKDKKDYRILNVCRFCERNIVSDKVRDHCLLTGKYRGQLIVNVISMLLKIKVISYSLYFTILVNTIVLCSLKN